MARHPFDDDEFVHSFFECLPVETIVQMYTSCRMVRDQVSAYADQIWKQSTVALRPSRRCPCYVVQQCRTKRLTKPLAAGPSHSLVCSRDGDVASFGYGAYGKLGAGFQATWTPRLVLGALARIRVVQVAAGARHSMALGACGRCYGWGANDRYQLGISTAVCVPSPVKITKNVVSIAVGDEHSLFLSNSGELRACGARDVAGIPNFDDPDPPPCLQIPTTFPRLGDILQVAAHGRHSLALDTHRNVYSWGKGDGGCLGHGDDHDRLEPTIIRALAREPISHIDCGRETSCAYAEPNRLFWWGIDKHAVLRHGFWSTPTLLPLDDHHIDLLALGGGTAGAVVVARGVAVQLHRDLGGNGLRRRRLQLPKPCVAVSCSDDHILCCLDDASVLVSPTTDVLAPPRPITALPWSLL